MDVGDRIKEIRNIRGLTLKEVAEKLNVKEATVQRYESGNIKNLKQETIGKLSEIFNVDPAWLMGWQKENVPTEQDNKPCSNGDVENLYRALVASGMIPSGGDLTDRQLDFLDGIAAVISAFFDEKG